MSQNVEKFGVEAVWLDAAFERGIREYNRALIKAEGVTVEFSRGASKAMQQLDRTASLSFTEIRSALQLALCALRTFGRVAAAAFREAQQGAQQLKQRRSFAIVSGGAIQAAKNLEAMREATRGTATDAELMEQALGVLGLGLAKNEDELFQVVRNVTQLGSTFKGFSADRAIQSFTLLTSNFESSKLRLDDFGLTVADVQPKIDALTDSGVDMQDAIRISLLEAMDEKMEQLGLTTETTADSFGRATATAGNLANEFKQALAPGASLVADAFVTAVTNSDDLEEAWDKLADAGVRVGAAIAAIVEGIQKGPGFELQAVASTADSMRVLYTI